jgi:transposase
LRNVDISQPALFITCTVDDFVPANYPLRAICKRIDEVLRNLDVHFNRLYADEGRKSVAPERPIRALRLQVLYSIRRERQLVEQNRYNLLYS